MSDSQWRDIETAPKDGTHILVYTVHGEIELTSWYEIRHEKYEPVSDGLFRREEDIQFSGWNGNMPTHWMPLPAPPEP